VHPTTQRATITRIVSNGKIPSKNIKRASRFCPSRTKYAAIAQNAHRMNIIAL